MGHLFSNNAQTTLVGDITSAATTLAVSSSTGFPVPVSGVSTFKILVDAEIMIVSAVSGTTWTVQRGVAGTAAAAHTSGAGIANIITAADLPTHDTFSGTTDASGNVNIPHGLGAVPSEVLLIGVTTSAGWWPMQYNPTTTSSVIGVVCFSASGTRLASTAVTIKWVAWPPHE